MKNRLLQKLAWALLLGVLLVLPHLLPNNYYRGVVNLSLIYAIVAMGLNFIYGYTGYISFAQAGFFGVGAYTSALLVVDAHWGFWSALPIAGLAAAACGVAIGIPALKLSSHYLAMATIGFGIIIQMVMQNWERLTHGASGVHDIPSITIGTYNVDSAVGQYYFLLGFLALAMFVTWAIDNSKLGRSFKAVREDEIAASSAGIDLTFTKVFSFALSAFFGGVGGSLYAHTSSYISPDTFSFDQSIVLFTMVLVGGAGTVCGPVIGAIGLTLAPELLRFLKEYYMALVGVGIVLIMIYMPQGVVHLFSQDGRVGRWLQSVKQRSTR
ncbi:MAG: branched-chain amino acid ABC transporter permease [Candidatus Korobacteraceae bacterium]|jgi:branched-chain amino acid transport system permease protein